MGPTASSPAVTGAALYGVWLPWGLLYVGQTLDAARRLRDLPVGESHHLANTFPPETWDRVVVISWALLPDAAAPVLRIGEKAVGLALEHEIQRHATPLANASRRRTGGGWRLVDPVRSKSLGARSAGEVAKLAAQVQALWVDAVTRETSSPVMRVVRPSELTDPPGSR